MQYTVGYQWQQNGALIDEILRQSSDIYEVYFSYGDEPSGRGGSATRSGSKKNDYILAQEKDLARLSENGIKLNLLLNANCYGENSLSSDFLMRMGDLIDYLKNSFNLSSVTTTSPVIARFVKENFDDIKTRASVNMEIGTIEGMQYLADVFDGYYYKRELNCDIKAVAKLKKWCDANGKELFMLANSGCLNYCSSRQFHDNLVAHEVEIGAKQNNVKFRSVCSSFIANPTNKEHILRHLNFVRPEEIEMFEPYVTAAKLATRISLNPQQIVRAYTGGRFTGNILDLLEPNHASAFYPEIIDSDKLPADFNHIKANCDKNCQECGYCKKVYNESKVKLDFGGIVDANK